MENLVVILRKSEPKRDGRHSCTCLVFAQHGGKLKAPVTHHFQNKIRAQSWETVAAA